MIKKLADEGTVIVDDSNPIELSHFVKEKRADIFIGGVKERPIAHKIGLGFCDHNHERKYALGGFEGIQNFMEEINLSINSPVWRYGDSRHRAAV